MPSETKPDPLEADEAIESKQSLHDQHLQDSMTTRNSQHDCIARWIQTLIDDAVAEALEKVCEDIDRRFKYGCDPLKIIDLIRAHKP